MVAEEPKPPPVESISGLCYDGFRIGLMFPEGDKRADEAFGTNSSQELVKLECIANAEFKNKFVWFKGERYEYGSEEHKFLLRTARKRFGPPPTA